MIYWPFDSIVSDDGEGNLTYDREFNSANLRKIFKTLYTTGIAMSDDSTALQVIPGTGMNVIVKRGTVIVEGAMGNQEEDVTVVIDAASASYARIDAIVVRLNTNISGRSISIEYIKGTEGSVPSVPVIERSGGIYDLRLANIRIPAGTTALNASMITDTRLGTECGLATARPQKVDTESIFRQYEASLEEYMQYVQDCINGTTAGDLQRQLNDIQNPKLSGSLAEKIDTLNSSIEALQKTLNQPIFMFKTISSDNIVINSNWAHGTGARDISVSGYRAIAIRSVGIFAATSGGCYSNWCVPSRCYIYWNNGDKLNYYIWNQHPNAAAKIKFEFSILYVKASLVA